jgi:hypothetical protein
MKKELKQQQIDINQSFINISTPFQPINNHYTYYILKLFIIQSKSWIYSTIKVAVFNFFD